MDKQYETVENRQGLMVKLHWMTIGIAATKVLKPLAFDASFQYLQLAKTIGRQACRAFVLPQCSDKPDLARYLPKLIGQLLLL